MPSKVFVHRHTRRRVPRQRVLMKDPFGTDWPRIASIQKTRDETMVSIQKTYDEAIASARKTYDEAIESAWKTLDEAEAKKAYDGGKSLAEVAEKLGVSVPTARKVLVEVGTAIRPRGRPTKD